MKGIIILLFYFVLCACQRIGSETKSSNSSTITPISGKHIIFFSITPEEYKKALKKEGKYSRIDEVLEDFNLYSSQVADSVSKLGIKTIITTNKSFSFLKADGSKSILSRDTNKGFVGIMIFDGIKEPFVKYGIMTDINYFTFVDEYFSKK